MALSGTITGLFLTATRHWKIIVTGMTTATTSPLIQGKGYQNSSFVVSGTAGAAFSGQWQGSNDSVNFVNIGSAIPSLSAGGTLTPNGVNFEYYQFVISGGDATTLVKLAVDFISSNAS